MEKYHIKLTETERGLVEAINLRTSELTQDKKRAACEVNKGPILALLKSLGERGAIPKVRQKYWNDPDYNAGRVKASHRGVFERKGRTGQEIYTHPHFLPYLRYFLFGADLPDVVIAKFEEKVGNPDDVTSSDILPINGCARDLARQHQLERAHAAEEFFKLCLDIGLDLGTATSVRRSVKQLR